MRPDGILAAVAADHARLSKTAHVGVLVPWANVTVESDLPRLGLERIVFHYARLVPARRHRVADDFLRELSAAVPAARCQLARLPLAGTLLACTAVGFTMPTPRTNSTIATAFDALVSGLRRLDARSVVLATPYPVAWTAREAEAFAARDIAVLGHASLGLGLFDDYAAVTPDQIRALTEQAGRDTIAAAHALVLSCTAWPTLGMIAALEDTFGVPVISSNLALGWQSVQLALCQAQA